jgi:hypothetical protein
MLFVATTRKRGILVGVPDALMKPPGSREDIERSTKKGGVIPDAREAEDSTLAAPN